MKRDWLVERREQKGMSQSKVASMAGISQSSYWEFENGKSSPKPETAQRIGAALGFPWTDFYTQKSDNVDAFEEATE